MARGESLEIGGFYALPEQHARHIGLLFKSSYSGSRILDPCAGEGEAIRSLASTIVKPRVDSVATYAIELEPDRAQAAQALLGKQRVLHDDMFLAEVTPDAFGLVFCNPPFTWDTATPGQRREFGMLKHTWRWVQPGGYMVFVSYAHHLSLELLNWVASRSELMRLYRLPELHFDTYCYTILIARRANGYTTIGGFAESLYQQAQNPEQITLLSDAPKVEMVIPTALSGSFYFQRGQLRASDILDALNGGGGADSTQAFLNAVKPKPEQAIVRPAMNVRRGHLLTLVAAGMFNYVGVVAPDGQPAILRSTIRYEERLVKEEETARGKQEIYQLTPVTHAAILKQNGEIEYFTTEARLLELLETYSEQLFAYIAKMHQPRYVLRGDTPAKRRWLPHLKGQRVKGVHPFLPAQMHTAAAVCTLLAETKRALLVGQMSTGKSSISLGIMEAWRREGKIKRGQVMWVNCPNILVKKWAREARLQHPHAHITILALELDGERKDMLAELGRAMRLAEAYPDHLHIIIAAQDAVKLGEGWDAAYVMRRGQAVEPTTYAPIAQSIEELSKKQHTHEGRPLWQEARKFRLPKGHNGRVKRVKGKLVSLTGAPILDPWLAQQGVYVGSNPRGPIWRLLQMRYKGRIAIAFFDETHQSNSIATDRYRSMRAIAEQAECVVGLSGTIYSGYASSLYGLETIFDPDLFRSYEWGAKGIAAWVRDMGVLEKVIEYRDEYSTNGTYTGTKRIAKSPREAPGASPLLIQRIIGHTVFLNLADLGKALPELHEQPISVEMEKEQAANYAEAKRKLGDYLRKCRQQADNTFTGAYYHALLKYPDHATMPAEVEHRRIIRSLSGHIQSERREVVARIPAISGNKLPKEDWLIATVQRELAEGRGVGLFVTHSGTYLQDRLAKLLKGAGAKPVVMTSDVKPIEREAWIETQFAKGINVLICNPRLVEVGLDLVMCPTLIFYEPEPQFSTLKQSAHRHWRIPQTKPCRTYFVYYAGTMQERLVALTAKKLKANNIVNGEKASLSALNDFEAFLDDLVDDAKLLDLHAEFAALNAREFDDSEWLDGMEYEPSPDLAPIPASIAMPATTNLPEPQSIPSTDANQASSSIQIERSQRRPGDAVWWWVLGNTYQHRELLRRLGGRWSPARKAWWLVGEALPDEVQALVNGDTAPDAPPVAPAPPPAIPSAIVPLGTWTWAKEGDSVYYPHFGEYGRVVEVQAHGSVIVLLNSGTPLQASSWRVIPAPPPAPKPKAARAHRKPKPADPVFQPRLF